jgi:hypothetical protein
MANPPGLVEVARQKLRVRHLRRYVYFHQRGHPRDLGAVAGAILVPLGRRQQAQRQYPEQGPAGPFFVYRSMFGVRPPRLTNATQRLTA